MAARRAAAPRERPEQRRVRVDGRRQGRHRRGDRRGRGRRPPAARQPAPHPEPDGDARRHRLVQPGHRRVHGLDVEPDAAHPAAAADRLRDGHPRAQDPVHQPGRRRRLRHQDLLLRRHGPRACSPARPSAAAGQVDRGPPRELPEHDPRPRPHHLPRDRRQARRRDHRAPRQDPTPTSAAASRRSGRASRRRSTAECCPAATSSPTSTARSPASTRTPRSSTRTAAPAAPRRPTSSSGRWTCSPTRSAWTGRRSGANFIPPDSSRTRTRPASAPRPAAPRSTSTRATTSRRSTRRWRWPATTMARRSQGQVARQATSASASRPTSRCAASRRRSGSVPSARAGAPRCGSRPTSGST